MKLHEHPEFEQAILAAAEHFRARGIRASLIEKDYFVTEELRVYGGSGSHLARRAIDMLLSGRNLSRSAVDLLQKCCCRPDSILEHSIPSVEAGFLNLRLTVVSLFIQSKQQSGKIATYQSNTL